MAATVMQSVVGKQSCGQTKCTSMNLSALPDYITADSKVVSTIQPAQVSQAKANIPNYISPPGAGVSVAKVSQAKAHIPDYISPPGVGVSVAKAPNATAVAKSPIGDYMVESATPGKRAVIADYMAESKMASKIQSKTISIKMASKMAHKVPNSNYIHDESVGEKQASVTTATAKKTTSNAGDYIAVSHSQQNTVNISDTSGTHLTIPAEDKLVDKAATIESRKSKAAKKMSTKGKISTETKTKIGRSIAQTSITESVRKKKRKRCMVCTGIIVAVVATIAIAAGIAIPIFLTQGT